MEFFVMGLVLVLVTIGFVVASNHVVPERGRKGFMLLGAVISGLLAVVLVGCSLVRVVPTGHTGVVTTFGRVEEVTYEAGIHFVAPWKDVTNMDNRTQKAQMELACFSSDIQEVTVVYTINYQIDKSNAQTIYRTIGTDYYNTVVLPEVQESVKGVFAQYNAENLVNLRNELSPEIEVILSEALQHYNIEIVGTAIENIDFTDEFTNAVEAKQVAQQNKLRAQTEQEQAINEANAQAKMEIIEADAKAQSQVIAANADAEVAKIAADSAEYQGQKDAAIMSNLGRMLQTYPELIKYYYATGWDGQLPTTVLGDDVDPLMNMTQQ